MFKVIELNLEGVCVLIPDKFEDKRGFFSEIWNKKTFSSKGINIEIVQENQAYSKQSKTIRGLHFQAPPFAQAKLVRCSRGSILDVAVDIRKGSPTYGKWVSEEISFKNRKQIFIPLGFLHGYVTNTPDTEVVYVCSNYYDPKSERSVRFDDQDININWKVNIKDVIISKKDLEAPLFNELESPFFYEK